MYPNPDSLIEYLLRPTRVET